jgi:hypothetical protein
MLLLGNNITYNLFPISRLGIPPDQRRLCPPTTALDDDGQLAAGRLTDNGNKEVVEPALGAQQGPALWPRILPPTAVS